jgi:hypothetical protein
MFSRMEIPKGSFVITSILLLTVTVVDRFARTNISDWLARLLG